MAYPDHLRLSLPVLEELATIPALVARKWCIDEARIYLTGQSDGGMAANAIAPSGAGVNGKNLAEYSCPEPLPVMVMHSRNDTVFPGLFVAVRTRMNGVASRLFDRCLGG